jgi:hypothetical protein
VPALDFTASALCFFALAAWNLCGAAAMPAFLLFSERVVERGTGAFAVGQMKTVMALFVLGWLQLAVAIRLALTAVADRRSGQGVIEP